MNATEEWLRYVENRAIRQRYGIKKYDSEESEADSKNDEDDLKEDEKSTKDSGSV